MLQLIEDLRTAGYPAQALRVKQIFLLIKNQQRKPKHPRKTKIKHSTETEVQPYIETAPRKGPVPGSGPSGSGGTTMWVNERELGPLWTPRNIEFETRVPRDIKLDRPWRGKLR